MSTGKYSPACSVPNYYVNREFKYNSLGKIPPEWTGISEYDESVYLVNYDQDGYDSYGYSAYDENGNYVGVGNGVDKYGNTEDDYQLSNEYDEDGNLVYSLYNQYHGL